MMPYSTAYVLVRSQPPGTLLARCEHCGSKGTRGDEVAGAASVLPTLCLQRRDQSRYQCGAVGDAIRQNTLSHSVCALADGSDSI